ncbi:MAG: nucleotidyl transferase AbiEii/AbiGii toxin family protein [Planctomycetota bacterium]
MTRYARHRLLYRLTQLPEGRDFILKGATLLAVWGEDFYRPTRDIDLLAPGANDPESLRDIFRSACEFETEDDGLRFDPDSVTAERIMEEARYEGVRVAIRAALGKARLFLQVDVAFGDRVIPPPVPTDLTSVLDGLPTVHMDVYPKTGVIAEKFQIITALGMPNSRMKDFYDIYTLAEHSEFEGQELADSIRATFDARGTPVPVVPPVALTEEFANDASKKAQWRAFLGGLEMSAAELPLERVIPALNDFLMPPARAIAEASSFNKKWAPGGPWSR